MQEMTSNMEADAGRVGKAEMGPSDAVLSITVPTAQQQNATAPEPGTSSAVKVTPKLTVVNSDPSATSSKRTIAIHDTPPPFLSPSGNVIDKYPQDWEGVVGIGLLTSESPDAVAAWRGHKHSRLYGKPHLACQETARVLVLPEPLYCLWPNWMRMREVDSGPSRSDTCIVDTEVLESASTVIRWRRINSHARPQDAEHFLRSNYHPNIIEMPSDHLQTNTK